MFEKLKTERGVGGISILIGFVIAIFVAGMVIMAITLVGSEMMDAVDSNDADLVINDTYQSVASLTDWFGTFNTMIAAVVIMGLLALIVGTVGRFGFRGGGA